MFLSTLNQYYRILATGLCFVTFGLGSIILSFMIIPLIKLSFNKEKQALHTQIWIKRCFRLFCEIMKLSRAMSFNIEGLEKLRSEKGNVILIANHPSLIDYVVIASNLNQCDCLVKGTLWNNFFLRHIVQTAGFIPNRSGSELISLCQKRFKKGNVLLIFPEGTRTKPGSLPEIQRGAAQIAIRTQTDIRRIHINVTPPFLTKEKKWYQVPKIKPHFSMSVEEKIAVTPFIKNAKNENIAARNLNNHIKKVLFTTSITNIEENFHG